MDKIYLDCAATAGYKNVDDIIVDTIANAMRNNWYNPSSLYSDAANVKDKINKCRKNIANFIGAESNNIYFTSGASESNSWAIQGWINNHVNDFKTIITTRIEHKSILECVEGNTDERLNVEYIGVNKFGILNMFEFEERLSDAQKWDEKIFVTIHHANNEIGTVQDIKRIAEIVHKYNGIIHVDATQTFGHIPIDVKELGIDMMSASGHKISPVLKGVGILYKKGGIDIKPLIYGSQESGIRGGTENTYGIIGLNKALEYCDLDNVDKLCGMRDYLINLLKSKFGCKLNGHQEHRLPNNINITFPQSVTGESLLYSLDMCGISIGTGSACNSKKIKKSYVLKEIGLEDDDALRTIRITLPENITHKDIDYIINEIIKVISIIEA